jgi:FixJ family two-component response regulator
VSGTVAVHLVDDDAPFLVALTRLLAASGFEVHPYASGAHLMAQISPQTRGCIVADLRMSGLNGLELQQSLAHAGVSMPFVFLTGHGDVTSAVCAMRQGAIDFLEKCAPKETLIAAVMRALERERETHELHVKEDELQRRFAKLTNREREVLRFVVHGRMNKQIAAALGIHERTVKLHRTAITSKIGVHSVAELTLLASEANLFEHKAQPYP